MIVKLKTIEQLIEEFGFEYDEECYTTEFNDMFWFINNTMFKQLGKEIEVEKIEYDSFNYTHRGKINDIKWYWHKLWFEPNDFFKEDEFEI